MGSIGRNAPCPCGSGKKYKRCCLGADEATRRQRDERDAFTATRGLGERVAFAGTEELVERLAALGVDGSKDAMSALLELVPSLGDIPRVWSAVSVGVTTRDHKFFLKYAADELVSRYFPHYDGIFTARHGIDEGYRRAHAGEGRDRIWRAGWPRGASSSTSSSPRAPTLATSRTPCIWTGPSRPGPSRSLASSGTRRTLIPRSRRRARASAKSSCPASPTSQQTTGCRSKHTQES